LTVTSWHGWAKLQGVFSICLSYDIVSIAAVIVILTIITVFAYYRCGNDKVRRLERLIKRARLLKFGMNKSTEELVPEVFFIML
jgi:hypothetical protein